MYFIPVKNPKPKVYHYCLQNIAQFHPITEDLLNSFVELIKYDQAYQKNAPIYLDAATGHYLLEGWENSWRLVQTRHKKYKKYSGICWNHKGEFHPLINNEFELNNYEGIEIIPHAYYWSTKKKTEEKSC